MNKYIISVIGIILATSATSIVYGLSIKDTHGQATIDTRESVVSTELKPDVLSATTLLEGLDETAIRKIIVEEISRLAPPAHFPTLASIDPEKDGFQEIYLPGSFINDIGTFFTATNISADTLTAAGANVGSISATSGIDAEGDINSGGTVHSHHFVLGSTDNRTGITVYDRATGEAVCIFAENGIVQAENGICSD